MVVCVPVYMVEMVLIFAPMFTSAVSIVMLLLLLYLMKHSPLVH